MSDQQRTDKPRKMLLSFFKKAQATNGTHSLSSTDVPILEEEPSSKFRRIEAIQVDLSSLERDPGLRQPIWTYSVNQQDDVRRSYILMGAFQPQLKTYPPTKHGNQNRRFNYSWFMQFPWLEYSLAKDKAYCFACFLFDSNPPNFPKFTVEGFNGWKRVKNGSKCSFGQHVGVHCSSHNTAMQKWENLKNPSRHIDKVINAQSSTEVLENRLRLKTTINLVKLLAMQACAFRGHDESPESDNRGNFLEFLQYSATLNEDIARVVKYAPRNAKYTSPMIQKEVLHILAEKVRSKIREEVGDARFCILVDEALDESNREQMAIVIRYVDCDGFVRERFLDIVGVDDTSALTLKKEICSVLTRYNLLVENIRGQGYDGASNMRGSWNGLQALFLKECPYAYYMHCFAHRLQLALVAVAHDVPEVWKCFLKITSIVNLVNGSAKRHLQLKSAREVEIADMLASGELNSGRGANQIHTLQRAGDTRWSSHFGSISRLVYMFSATRMVLENISVNAKIGAKRSEALGAFKGTKSFKFCFLLLLMKKVMGVTEILCQALQCKSQDILVAVSLVSSTKTIIQNFRHDGWDNFLADVISFCEKYEIDIPDFSVPYMSGTRRSCQQQDDITLEHYYRVDLFYALIDCQLSELNRRFQEHSMELLLLSASLDPIGRFTSFNIDNICKLAEKFYPGDFTEVELHTLRRQLEHYEFDVLIHPKFQNLSSLSELCHGLAETNRVPIYFLIDRLVRLVLTLPVTTATTERAFSSMKHVKTALRNKMEDEFLADCLVVHIERRLAKTIDSDLVVNDFYALKNRRAQLI